MKLAVLFSGGKDSVYATYLASKEHEISCLISIFSENPESYMFHTPSIDKTRKQAEVMGIPLIVQKTKGVKEEELKDLEKAIEKAKEGYQIQGIVTGTILSIYQKSRIQKICDKLNLKCINPLWEKNEDEYWNELFKNDFKIMIVGVASEGLDKKWLGKIINKKSFEELKQLSKKYLFNLEFEGGEAETFVLDCPLFKKELKVVKAKKIWEKNNGRYIIKNVELVNK